MLRLNLPVKSLGESNLHSRLLLLLGCLGLSPAQSCSPPELHQASRSAHRALLFAEWHAHSLGSALWLEQRDMEQELRTLQSFRGAM